MSNTTTMFGVMALFAVGVIFYSPLAASAFVPNYNDNEDFLDLKSAKLDIKNNVTTDIKFTAKGIIPIVNPGIDWGYGIITAAGNVIATTSHPELPIVDSILQNDDPTNDVIHNHYVLLGENELCGDDPAIADLSFESPGDIFVKQNQAILKNLPASVTGGNFDPEPTTFTPGADYQAAASFQLEYVEEENNPNNFAVCVVDIRALDPLEQSTVIIGKKDFDRDHKTPYGDQRPDYNNYGDDDYGNQYPEENSYGGDDYGNQYPEENSYGGDDYGYQESSYDNYESDGRY
jgi:hypothetical protein